jgi:hypothetical protein
MRRRHRRKHHPATSCGCPDGSRKVPTGKQDGKSRGRGWGCLGTGLTRTGKPIPRFLPPVCALPEAGPVTQWKKPKKGKRSKKPAAQLPLFEV